MNNPTNSASEYNAHMRRVITKIDVYSRLNCSLNIKLRALISRFRSSGTSSSLLLDPSEITSPYSSTLSIFQQQSVPITIKKIVRISLLAALVYMSDRDVLPSID